MQKRNKESVPQETFNETYKHHRHKNHVETTFVLFKEECRYTAVFFVRLNLLLFNSSSKKYFSSRKRLNKRPIEDSGEKPMVNFRDALNETEKVTPESCGMGTRLKVWLPMSKQVIGYHIFV